MPVFIILGIGGTPAAPAEIFVVPLASIEQVELSKSWLEHYRHDPSQTMFFDVSTKTLRYLRPATVALMAIAQKV